MSGRKRNGALSIPAHWAVQDPARYKPLAWFKPYPGNPRVHPPYEIELLAALIGKYGPDQAIVVDDRQEILKGHGRLESAARAGLTHFIFDQHRGLSENDKREMRIADNQLPLLATWSQKLITSEIQDLKLVGYDIGLLGFPEAQLRGWGVSMGTESDQDAEAAPDPPKVPIVRKDDVWLLGKHRLLCGDSTNAEDVATALNGAKPHLMVTDPPYGVNYDPNWRNEPEKLNLSSPTAFQGGGGKRHITKAIGKVSNDHQADWERAWRLFAGDVAYVWCGERQSVDMARQLSACELDPGNLIVWGKAHLVISRGHYHSQHETCWYAVRRGRTGHWNGDRSQTTLWSIPNIGTRKERRKSGNRSRDSKADRVHEAPDREQQPQGRRGLRAVLRLWHDDHRLRNDRPTLHRDRAGPRICRGGRRALADLHRQEGCARSDRSYLRRHQG